MPIVFVISKDWTLRVTVRAELLHARIEALGMESVEDAGRALAQGNTPSAIVLDAAAEEYAPPSAKAALEHLAKRVPVVVVASRIKPAPPLEGAAVLLYRPVRVGDIVARVKELLAGQAA